MKIVKSQDGGKVTLTLIGRLDTTTAPELQAALLPEFGDMKQVVLDFKELAYVSSAGLRVLLLGEKSAKGSGASLSFVNVSDEIREIFEMTGFSDIFKIV